MLQVSNFEFLVSTVAHGQIRESLSLEFQESLPRCLSCRDIRDVSEQMPGEFGLDRITRQGGSR